MKRIAIIFLFVSHFVLGQTLEPISSTNLEAEMFVGMDSYQNTYFVKDRVLHKQGADGVYIFNDFQLGDIASVDIINPLKIVVFYADTNTVLFLDNRLNEIERINFNETADFMNLGSATNAGGNKLWVFNVDTQELELYNYRDKKSITVSQPFPGKLLSMQSNFNYCYLLTENNLRGFNIYGSLLSEIPSAGFDKIAIEHKNLVVVKENEVFKVTENSFEPIKLPISENPIKDLQLTKDFLYIYDGNKLHTFSIKQPKQ